MSIEVVYTTAATATGGGRDGHVKSDDGRLDLDTRPPKAMGGNGEGTNPEQLFAAGYAACFLGALRLVAGFAKVKLDDATDVTVEVGFGKDPEGGFGLTGKIVGYLPGLEQGTAEDLVHQAHQVCPYSKATKGNVGRRRVGQGLAPSASFKPRLRENVLPQAEVCQSDNVGPAVEAMQNALGQ